MLGKDNARVHCGGFYVVMEKKSAVRVSREILASPAAVCCEGEE